MEDEGNPPILELAADRCAVVIAEIEIQDTCRQMRVVGQTKRLGQMGRGKNRCSGALQAPGKVQADQRLIFYDQDGPSRQVQASHHVLREGFKPDGIDP
jgi:hypothetical protein